MRRMSTKFKLPKNTFLGTLQGRRVVLSLQTGQVLLVIPNEHRPVRYALQHGFAIVPRRYVGARALARYQGAYDLEHGLGGLPAQAQPGKRAHRRTRVKK